MCLSRLQVILSKVSEVFIDFFVALYSQVYDGENMSKNYLKWWILYSISDIISATGTPAPFAI